MRQYEVTFIVDPVLSGDEIKSTAKTYQDMLSTDDNAIVSVEEIGLRQLTYPINKRTSGIYYVIEFTTPDGTIIPRLELALRRDERIMRFLTVKLDKNGVKYNEDKRNGLIGKVKKKEKKKDRQDNRRSSSRDRKPTPAPAPAAETKAAETKAAPETKAPVEEAKTPVVETPAPVIETPAPVVEEITAATETKAPVTSTAAITKDEQE